VYPVSVLLIACALAWYMLRNVVPPFAKILLDSGMELALSNRVLISASEIPRSSGNPVLAGLAGAVWAGSRMAGDPRVRDAAGAQLARVPFVGPLVQANAMASFCGMPGLLLASGVRTVDALALAAETVPNRRTARAVAAAVPEVAEGRPIAAALERTGVVPMLVSRVAAVGERSGGSGRGYVEGQPCTYINGSFAMDRKPLPQQSPD
jgi:type II secretory pathway component PulF